MTETKMSWPEKQSIIFNSRFADWLKLRADLAAMDQEDDERTTEDEKWQAEYEDLDQRKEDAGRLAMTTPVNCESQLWDKFEILDDAMNKGCGNPRWADHRQFWMLAAIKADMAANGFFGRRSA